MPNLRVGAFASLTCGLLAACGGGGGGGDSTPAVPSTPRAANGLAFATGTESISDAEGTAMTLTSGGYRSAAGGSTSVDTGTVLLNAGALSGALNGQVQISGETVTITNGFGTTVGGNTVAATYESDRSGMYVGALEFQIIDGGGGIVGEDVYVFGFATDPAAIAARTSGSLTFAGGFQSNGLMDGSEAEYEGTITLTVNFAGSGTISGSLDGTLDGSRSVDMTLGNTGLSGNVFNGPLSCTGCSSGSGNIDGTFYGPDADEVGGILTFDFDASGSGGVFDGAGTFVLTDPTP